MGVALISIRTHQEVDLNIIIIHRYLIKSHFKDLFTLLLTQVTSSYSQTHNELFCMKIASPCVEEVSMDLQH